MESSVGTHAAQDPRYSISGDDSVASELARTVNTPDAQDVDVEYESTNVNVKELFMVEADALVAEFNVNEEP